MFSNCVFFCFFLAGEGSEGGGHLPKHHQVLPEGAVYQRRHNPLDITISPALRAPSAPYPASTPPRAPLRVREGPVRDPQRSLRPLRPDPAPGSTFWTHRRYPRPPPRAGLRPISSHGGHNSGPRSSGPPRRTSTVLIVSRIQRQGDNLLLVSAGQANLFLVACWNIYPLFGTKFELLTNVFLS